MNNPMTIIEGLKSCKMLEQKLHKIQMNIAENSCELEFKNKPFNYGTRSEHQEHIDSQMQRAHDIVKEIENIQLRISKTNLNTDVTIEIDGKQITKSISAWILRRRKLARLERDTWQALTNKRLKPEGYRIEGEEDALLANPYKFYDQKKRDLMVEIYDQEPALIDSKLEVANAVTQLLTVEN